MNGTFIRLESETVGGARHGGPVDTNATPVRRTQRVRTSDSRPSRSSNRTILRPISGAVDLQAVLKRQHQVITRAQAVAGGLAADTLSRRARPGGPWQRLLPGIYLTVTGTPTTDQREMAALLYCGPASTLTGVAALRRHGQRVPASETVDVLVPARRRRQSTSFVTVHRTTRVPDPVCYVGDIQYVLPARGVADAVTLMDDADAVRALVARAVQSGLCTIEQLTDELRHGSMRGSACFRAVLAEVVDGVRSVAEARLRQLIRASQLPLPLFNARLYIGDRLIAVADAWWSEFGVVAEVDSKEWHLSPEDFKRTMQRHARLTALGILVLHFLPQQLRDEPKQVLATIGQTIEARRELNDLQIRTEPASG
jgi:very-short-patch-repair endonuclease